MSESRSGLKFCVNGINYVFESYDVKRMVDFNEIVETVNRNAKVFVNYMGDNDFTFYFQKMKATEGDLTNVYFYVDIRKRTIYFNVYMLEPFDLLYHYISYAIIHTCDTYCLKYSFADHVSFKAMMVVNFTQLCNVAFDTVQKMCDSFEAYNCGEDGLDIKMAYEYVEPHKFLYESYALIVDGNDEIKKECEGLYKLLCDTYFK